MAVSIFKKITLLNQATLEALDEQDSLAVIKKFTEAGLKILEGDFGFAWWKLEENEDYKLAYKSSNTPYEPNLPRKKGGNYNARKNKAPVFFSLLKSEDYEPEYDITPYMESYVIIPISYKNNLYGSFVICYKKTQIFSENDVSIANALGNTAAQAITINRLLKSEHKARLIAEKQEERFRSLIENSYDAILVTNEQNEILDVSNSIVKISGYDVASLMGRNFNEYIHLDDVEAMQLHLQKMLKEPNVSHTIQFRYRHNDNSWRWMESRSINLLKDLNVQGVVANLRDITERKTIETVLLDQTLHDPLTNLSNRKELVVRLEQALETAKRHNKILTVMYLDLDRFKNINDGLGHNVGDSILKVAASRFLSSVRAEDIVARMGGDEFVILLNNLNSVNEAGTVAEKILKAVSLPVQVAEIKVHVTVSIGIAAYPQDAQDSATLLRYADVAVYRAKESGRNRFKLYNNSMQGYDSQKFFIENELRQALAEKQIIVYYQPIIGLNKRRLIGVEALARWQHSNRGLLLPSEFIVLAEETGLILALDEYVLRQACWQLKIWQESGFPKFRVSVNLSARQFAEQGFIPMLTDILAENRLDPRGLELEITETVAMGNLELTSYNLKALKKLGVRITIDDFGTGYSTLSYLKRFPINCLKIDKTFVRHCITNEHDGSITRAIISMAHDLNLKVVAEGVETEQQLNFLTSLNCDAAQGFFISPPMPAERLPFWVGTKDIKQQLLSI